MKTMTCKQLGGACDMKFQGQTFDEIAQASHGHGAKMADAQDKAHLKAMDKMRELMKDSEAMKKWMEEKEKEFKELPED